MKGTLVHAVKAVGGRIHVAPLRPHLGERELGR